MNQAKPYRVLFVCWGNICRSPAAECVFKHYLSQSGLDWFVDADSAGTIRDHEGNPPDKRMRQAAARRGIEVKGAARRISGSDFKNFDLILAMDKSNLDEINWAAQHHRTNASIRLFCEYCTSHDEREVPDPYYGGEEGFDRVMDLLEDGCRNLIRDLEARLKDAS